MYFLDGRKPRRSFIIYTRKQNIFKLAWEQLGVAPDDLEEENWGKAGAETSAEAVVLGTGLVSAVKMLYRDNRR